MRGFERYAVIWALIYTALYMPFFILICATMTKETPEWVFFRVLMPLHFLAMAQNFLAFFFTLRDLYKRPFPRRTHKVNWCVLIVMTGGIGWIVYIFKHALKPRPSDEMTPIPAGFSSSGEM